MEKLATSQIRWFETLGMKNLESVRGKNANLGEMVRNLKSWGIGVLKGYAIMRDAYESSVNPSPFYSDRIQNLLHELEQNDPEILTHQSKKIENDSSHASFPRHTESIGRKKRDRFEGELLK